MLRSARPLPLTTLAEPALAPQRRFLTSREVDEAGEIEPAMPQFDREGYMHLFLMAQLHGKSHLLFSREQNNQRKDAEEPCLSSVCLTSSHLTALFPPSPPSPHT